MAVIDSGWDTTILEERIEPGFAFTEGPDGVILPSTDSRDRLGHGTAVADLILAVAPDVTILPIRVFGDVLETSPMVLVASIDAAVEQGVPLVNLSAGTLRSDAVVLLYAACERARRAGTVVVSAAANDGGGWSYPAVFDCVIGAAHVPIVDPRAVVYFCGEALECRANGVGQYARGLGGEVRSVSGASFAAPVVTGHIARLLAEGVPPDPDRIRSEMSARTVEP